MKKALWNIAWGIVTLMACQNNQPIFNEASIHGDTLTIKLQRIGTLNQCFEQISDSIKAITIIGNLNSSDMLTIRKHLSSPQSSIRHLNLLESSFTEGGEAYYIHQEDTLFTSACSIGEYQFSGCTQLQRIVLPQNTRSIGNSAFERCHALKEVIIPDETKQLGSYAFFDCYSLESIQLPGSISIIDECTFLGCESLKEITLPQGISIINHHAFMGCKSLSRIILPKSIISIGYAAFERCTSLTQIVLPENLRNICEFAFFQSPIEEIYLFSLFPPTVSTNSFNATNAILYVPESSYDLYITSRWKHLFSSIKGLKKETLQTFQSNLPHTR